MTNEASGPARPLTLSAEVGWHREQQQPLVVLRLNEGGAAITPEAAQRFAMALLMTASRSLVEAAFRSYLLESGLDVGQVEKSIDGLRARLNLREQSEMLSAQEHQVPTSVFMHRIRVDTTGDPQLSFHMVECQDCGAEPGQACRR